jgi:hypothetical protein
MDPVLGRVGLDELRQIISDTDPRKVIGKVIQQLHKDLAGIQKRAEKAKAEEKQKLRLIEHKIQEAIAALKNHDLTSALDLLEEIKSLDPESYELVRPEAIKLRQIEDKLRQLKMSYLVVDPGQGVLV